MNIKPQPFGHKNFVNIATANVVFAARSLCVAIAVLANLPLAAAADAAPGAALGKCSARSSAAMTRVVELYTSEGCSSCPQADRWLSRMAPEVAARADTVALAFHVDYWDRLGWKDRFASAAYTARQAQQQTSNGARFSYTPQVVMDGLDNKDWINTRMPLKAGPTALAQINLTREGNQFNATVGSVPGGPARLAAYWAVTELNHITTVKAGENEGVTLKHDFVVREYKPVAAWSAKQDVPTALSYVPSTPADPQHARQVNLVVIDADTGRPVQALKLGC
jgi:hypothetical protein